MCGSSGQQQSQNPKRIMLGNLCLMWHSRWGNPQDKSQNTPNEPFSGHQQQLTPVRNVLCTVPCVLCDSRYGSPRATITNTSNVLYSVPCVLCDIPDLEVLGTTITRLFINLIMMMAFYCSLLFNGTHCRV